MKKRKKLVAIALTLAAMTSALTFGACASFGSGVEVIAERCEIIKTGLCGTKIVFSDLDVKQALCITDFESIKVESVPESNEGTLMLAGRRVSAGQTIKRKNVGALVFIPASKDVLECSFSISVPGYLDGGCIDVVLRFTEKVNYTPTATLDDGVLKTQRNIRIYGRLTSEDREGDEVEYVIIKYPECGNVQITDRNEGDFVYTPPTDYVGEDKFTYVVRDSFGNFSHPVDVQILVEERMIEVIYSDMTAHPDYSAAVALTAIGATDGRLIGDGVYFGPDESVTRAEFVTMALKCAGLDPAGYSEVYFDDSEDIPSPMRSYVSYAAAFGIIKGRFVDGELLLRPNAAITRYEAAEIMSEILGVGECYEIPVFADVDDCPVYAESALYTMYSVGIFDDITGECASDKLTKASCVSALYKMMQISA